MRLPRLASVISLLSILLVGAFGTVYLLFGIARVDWFKNPTAATIVIPDSANLVERSPVLLSGIRVGSVTSVSNTDGGVEVELGIDENREIPVDSTVVIEALSALGEPYIDFRPRTVGGPVIADGQVVDARSIASPTALPDVARNITALVEQVDPAVIASLVQTFTEAFAGTDELIPALSHASDLIAATLVAKSPQIRMLLINAQIPGPDVAVAGELMANAGPDLSTFGVKVSDVVDSLERLMNARPVPDAYIQENGLLPFIADLTTYVDEIGPDIAAMYPVIGPLIDKASAVLGYVDFGLSALITQALNSVSVDGTIRLELKVK